VPGEDSNGRGALSLLIDLDSAETTPMEELSLADISHASAFELTIAYKDVADTGWITSGRWSAQSGGTRI
jgi:hypothetical protein